VGGHVFLESILQQRSSIPVSVTFLTPEVAAGQGIGTDGSNAFSLSRFLVPHLTGFSGYAIYVDCVDMLMRADVNELWEQRSGWHAVQVVKHQYRTKFARKYVGTSMEADNQDYPMKNASSVVIWNCGHYMNRKLTPEYIREKGGKHLHRFEWLPEDRIGELDKEWNWLCAEYEFNPSAKVAHWTLGAPFMAHYRASDYAPEWRFHFLKATEGMQPAVTVPSEK